MQFLTIANKVGDIGHGYTYEIQAFPQHVLDDDLTQEIESWQTKLQGIKPLGMHGASFDLNPGSTDEKILAVTRERYKQCVMIGQRLGVTHMVFHSQINPLISVPKIRKMKLDRQVAFWKDFLKDIPQGMTLLIENEYDDTFEDIKYLVEHVDHKQLAVCLDTGHVLAYSKVPLNQWFQHLKDHIRYIHLHWNDGTGDKHKQPSDQELAEFFRLYKYHKLDALVCLEYFNEDYKKEIQRLIKIKENEDVI